MDTVNLPKKIISVTELRKNFGEICVNLPKIDSLLLTRGGEPFAVLRALPAEKMKVLEKVAGLWKNTSLDNDNLWKKVFKRKSRKETISL